MTTSSLKELGGTIIEKASIAGIITTEGAAGLKQKPEMVAELFLNVLDNSPLLFTIMSEMGIDDVLK